VNTEDRFSLLNEFIARRGFIVVTSNSRYKVGQVVTRFNGLEVEHPFVVLAETDSDDWMAQQKIAMELINPEPDEEWPYGRKYFYRIMTD